MNNDLHKIIYCSRNSIAGELLRNDAEISQILATARVNNSSRNVTGALLYNSGFFAQVLEGPRASIESIFEKIQRDDRHGDVTVLESGSARHRDFAEWSMAHVRPPSEVESTGIAITLDYAFAHPSDAGAGVLDLLRTLVIQND